MLKIQNLKSGYGDVEVLHGIDIDIKPGTINAIIGPNGCGKTTVLKSIFNLCNIFSGKIIFKDKDITRLNTHTLIREGISYVPQGRLVFSDMTVYENLEMGAFIFNDKALLKKNIEDVYKKFPDLKEKRNERAGNLSGGQQQTLAIARALIQDPELILLDEPSLGLSPKMVKEVFKKIKEINKEGVTVVVVEQNINSALEIADKVFVLENGNLALSGDKSKVDKKHLKGIYFK